MQIDHLVYAGPDVTRARNAVSMVLGVEPTSGGQHVGFGTRNWLLALGGEAYLEVIGPDPAQPAPEGPRPFGIDALQEPRLVAWALRSFDIERDVAAAHAAGIDYGGVTSMQRARPDGVVLHWRLTPPAAGLLPFLIEWGDTPHPARDLPAGARLTGLRVETPDVAHWAEVMTVIGVDVTVLAGSVERLMASVVVGGGSSIDLA